MMRILYLSFVELDIPNACSTHTLGILSGFGNNLCKISAVVPRPKNVCPKIPGVRFYYIWPWRFSALGRLWTKILSGLHFFMLCLLVKFDVIYVREMELNPFPRWCSIIFRIPLYIEVNSILLQNMKMTGAGNQLILRARKYQAADFRHAKGLIVPSFPRCKWIIEYYGLNLDKVHLIMNGTDKDAKEKTDRLKALKSLNLPENGFYLGFLGTIWECYDLYGILEAMKICREQIPSLYLIMIGDGPEVSNLINRSKEINIDSRLIFLGYIQPESLYKIIGAVDVGLMNMTLKGIEFGGPITSRFATYAAFQLPVIASNRYIDKYPAELGNGLILVPPEDPQALADIIIWLYNHPDEKKEKVKILHDFVIKKLTWDSVAKKIIDIMKQNEPE